MTDQLPRSGAFTDPAVAEQRYVCLDRIGAGGMGLVWRARDTRLDREVALKTVPPRTGPPHEELEQRLEREVKIATRLRGQGVVRIEDRGTLPDGRPFLVMELLQTPALTHEPAHDLQILLQAARAVGDAHRQGIVHRDLKPSNLALRDGRCVVLDWGLAKPVEDSAWNERVLGDPLTASGVSVGTIGYMAPEQIAGGRTRPESDVWALGAMAYQLLTGHPPFDEASHRLLAQVSKGALDLPAGPVAAVVRRALSLDPTERHADGHAFADHLQRALRPVDAPPSRSWRTLGVGVGALLVGLALGAFGRPSTPPAPSAPADPALHVQLGQAYAAQGRFLEARARGELAEAIQTTPEGRGLLALPSPPRPQVVEHGCEQLTLLPRDERILCRRPDATTVLRGGKPIARFAIGTEESWLIGDQLLSRQDWKLYLTDTSGRSRQLSGSWRDHQMLVRPGGRGWLAAVGPTVLYRNIDGEPITHASGSTSAEALLLVGDQPVASVQGTLHRLDDGVLVPLIALGEPVVAAGIAGERAIFIGLRGLVVELDATTLAELDRYHLRHVAQVDAAAIGEDQIAVSTAHGVFVYRGGEPELQVSTTPAEQLSYTGSNQLIAADGTTTRTFDLEPARHLLMPTRASTTALRSGREPGIASGRRVLMLDPTRLAWGPTMHDSNDGIIRSLVFPGFHVENRYAYRRRGRSFERLGEFPVMTLLADGTAIGVRRWGRGFGVFDDETERLVEDTPPFVAVVTDVDGRHGLAVTDSGALYRLSADGSTEALGVDGVNEPIATGPVGRAVARGAEVELLGAWRATCADAVRSLAVDDRYVAVGTHSGRVCVYGADGTLLQRFTAHPERVSALMIWGDWLFSGSWAPGVRRWSLPVDQSRSTTSSSG